MARKLLIFSSFLLLCFTGFCYRLDSTLRQAWIPSQGEVLSLETGGRAKVKVKTSQGEVEELISVPAGTKVGQQLEVSYQYPEPGEPAIAMLTSQAQSGREGFLAVFVVTLLALGYGVFVMKPPEGEPTLE